MIHLSPWSLSYSSTQAAPTHGSSAASSKKLGIKPTTKWKLKTIESKIIEREIGEAVIECLGEKATTIIVFAEEKDTEVLGVYSLEGLRLEIDPTTRQLRKIEALLALNTYSTKPNTQATSHPNPPSKT